MQAARIRRAVKEQPFRPVEIRLESGEKHIVRHLESIVIGRTVVVILTPKEHVVTFEPSAVTSIRRLRNSNANRGRR